MQIRQSITQLPVGQKMALIQFLQQFDYPPILFLMKGITLLGNFLIYPLYILIGYVCLSRKKWFSFLGIILFSWGVNEALKYGFSLPRPPKEFHLVTVTGLGFPSGHAQMAVVVWGWLGMQYNRIVPAVVLILLIGLSRIYLGVHFLNQVVGGWFVGFTVLMIWVFIIHEIKKVKL